MMMTQCQAAGSASTALLIEPSPSLACMARDDIFYRSVSPLTVWEEDSDSDEEMSFEDISLTMDASCTHRPMEAPLKADSEPTDATRKSRVKFHPTVSMKIIPSHRDYSPQMKELIWTSLEELRMNAVKNQMQQYMEEQQMEDGNNDDTEPRFTPLRSMGRAR